jgi:hypothetical protein
VSDGSGWYCKPAKIWNGSAWVIKPIKYWTGSTWELSLCTGNSIGGNFQIVPEVINYNITASDGVTAVNSIDVIVPSGVLADDLLLIFAGNDFAAATPAQWDNSTLKPTGFTLINQITTATADACSAAFYKVASGTEGGTTISIPAQSTNDMWAACVVIRNANPITPINAIGTNWDNGSATAHIPPAVTTTVNNELVFFMLSADGADTLPFTISGTNWISGNTQQIGCAGGTAAQTVGGIFGWKSVVSAGSSQDVTITYAAADGGSGFQFSINPI